MQNHTRILVWTLTLAAFAVVPSFVQAQCTARINPAQVASGERAVPVTITVSEPIGEVTGLQAVERSGIALAAAADLPREPLAAGAAPKPIAMGDSENTWIVYLNLAEAEAGAHQLTFTSARGSCTAQLTVR